MEDKLEKSNPIVMEITLELVLMKECEVGKFVFCSLFLLSLISHFLDFVDNITYNNKISAIKMKFLV